MTNNSSERSKLQLLLSKEEVEARFLKNVRLSSLREKCYWDGNQLWREFVERNLFGPGVIRIKEPVYLQWEGKPVQVRSCLDE